MITWQKDDIGSFWLCMLRSCLYRELMCIAHAFLLNYNWHFPKTILE